MGLDNYRVMVDDPVFWKALTNNLWFALATIPLSIGLALVMALWVNERMAGRGFLRMAYFTPTVLPMVAVANIWLFFYTPEYGLLEQIAGALRPAGAELARRPAHRARRRDRRGGVEGGGLLHDLLPRGAAEPEPEPARGGGDRGRVALDFFRRVQWPLLMPTTLFVMVNAVINAVRMVDHIVVLTRGGPDNASTLLLFHLYEVGFRYWDSGYAAALTMVLLAVLAAVALLQFFVLDRRGALPVNAAAATVGTRLVYNDPGWLDTHRGLAAGAAVGPAAGLRGVDRLPPGEYATRFDLFAPLTLDNFARAWAAAPFARYFVNTIAAGDDDPGLPARAVARSPPTPSRASSSPARTCCSRWCWCS